MEPNKNMPQQVSYHGVVFILTPAVVCMKMDFLLTEPMHFKKVMEHADDSVSSFTHVNCLINEVVDLTWYAFAAHSENRTFSMC